MAKIANNILNSIGNTPLVSLARVFDSNESVFAKMEAANPAGSMKDRTSTRMVENLLKTGKIVKGDTVIESSSGNMAVGLAQVCKFYGLKLIVVVDPKLNPHVRKLLSAYNVTIDTVREPLPQGGFLAARLKRVHELLEIIPSSYWSNQYGNKDNPDAYHSTMAEISAALPRVDYLFVATSTCGSLMGCAAYIAEHGLPTKLIAVDAVGSVIFGGQSAKRSIPGHGAGIPSKFLDRKKIHDVVLVNDAECIKGCRALLEKEAILGGGSMGALVSAYMKYSRKIPQGSKSVLLFADRGERYLDTIYNDEWIRDNVDMGKKELPEMERMSRNILNSVLCPTR